MTRLFAVLFLLISGPAFAETADQEFVDCLHDSAPEGAAFWGCADQLAAACQMDPDNPASMKNQISCFRSVVSRLLSVENDYAKLIKKQPRNLVLAARVAGFKRDVRIGDAECAYLDEMADIGSNAKNTDFRLLSLMECRAHFYANAYWQNLVHEVVK